MSSPGQRHTGFSVQGSWFRVLFPVPGSGTQNPRTQNPARASTGAAAAVSNTFGMARSSWRRIPGMAAGAVVCLTTMTASQPQSVSPTTDGVAAALELYARGAHAQAVDATPLDGMNVVSVIAALEAWIGPFDPKTATPEQHLEHTRRGQVAARFVIDAAAFRQLTWKTVGLPMFDGQPTPSVLRIQPGPDVPWEPSPPPFDYESFNAPVVAWACARVPKTGPLEAWETGWWMASIALLQEAGEWGVLQGNQRVGYSGSEPPPWRLAVREEVGKGHLVEARQRLGALPRLRLAEAVTRSAALTDATARFVTGAVGPRLPGRYDVLRLLEDFASTSNSGRFTDQEREFEALLSEPGFEAEVSLRLAQLRLMRRDWPSAARASMCSTCGGRDETRAGMRIDGCGIAVTHVAGGGTASGVSRDGERGRR